MPPKKEFDDFRQRIISYLNKELIGPKNGPNEEIVNESLLKYYMAGILYPQKTELDKNEMGEENAKEIRSGSPDDTEDDTSVALSNEFYPSAMGLSFYVKSSNPHLEVSVSFGLYKKQELMPTDSTTKSSKKKSSGFKYVRTHVPALIPVNINFTSSGPIEESNSSLLCKWRKRGDNIYLVTLTLVNNNKSAVDTVPDPEMCFFQCKVLVTPGNPETSFSEFENFGFYSPDDERTFLEILYRKNKPFAVGHGCSVAWDDNLPCSFISTSSYPLAEIPPADFNINYSHEKENSEKALSLQYLISINGKDKKKVISSLKDFIKNYKNWIDSLVVNNSDIGSDLYAHVDKQVSVCNEAYNRMLEGILLIEKNKNVCNAFALANEAMLIQMIHTSVIRSSGLSEKIDLSKISYDHNVEAFKWRPFQLGFLLLTISSIVYDDFNKGRNIVDLIWFPTGGGKTEAYLGLSAFTILYQRILHKDKASGTNVITRYTLRALTAQQFQRTAILICALEFLRRKNSELLGNVTIDLGLFVGGDSSPNNIVKNYRSDDKSAVSIYESIESPGNYRNPFQLQNCPWCNQEIIPKKSRNKSEWGINISEEIFEFFCPNSSCEFHSFIPVNIVDEVLYRNPPDMLIGTVDKFARLTWAPRSYAFFGNNSKVIPPTLIIQDELHLITGPLGSIMGIYETAIDHLCSSGDIKPKIVASTATARSSTEQCLSLFDRDTRLFPPPGLVYNDSFFSKINSSEFGRLYIGIQNPGNSGLTTVVRVFAALLQGIHEMDCNPEVKDQFLTLIGYYNSLRELGKNLTLAVDDIPDRMKVIRDPGFELRELSHEELSSRIPSGHLPQILERLKKSKGESGFIDLLLATNMISVGIDIDRLGLMVMNGQPKTAAEYIQATSRIGRANPGLVVVLFSPTRIRDRSHYEKFKAFHEVFYKEVEPSAITPFAKPVRDRALHALLVILSRQYDELKENDSAHSFSRSHPSVDLIKSILNKRINNIDKDELNMALKELDEFVLRWENESSTFGQSLRYSRENNHGNNRQFRQLLRYFGNVSDEGVDTLNTMRNVEYEISLTELRRGGETHE